MNGGYDIVSPSTLVDVNGGYELGRYIDGRLVHVYGRRNGFVYLAFADALTFVTKVPDVWVGDA